MFQIRNLNKKENGKYLRTEEIEVHVLPEGEDHLRQVSLMAAELLPGIRQENGFCTKRFCADIETERLDYSNLSVGHILSIDDVSLQITSKGKRCFEDCPLRKEGKQCQLANAVAFARVVRGGRLKVHASGTETFQV